MEVFKLKKKKVGVSALILLLLLATVLTACTKEPAPGNAGGNPTNEGTGGISDPDMPEPDHGDIKQGRGSYNGQMDPHTIEIQTADGPNAFQLEEGLEEALDDLELDESVIFEYYEKTVEGDDTVKQLVITKLEKANKDNSGAGNGSADNGARPQSKEFQLEMEGMQETRVANLVQGDGYSLYVFEGFTFNPKEHTLSLDFDPENKAVITKLAADYNLDELEKKAEKELAQTGKIERPTPKQRNAAVKDAELFLIASGDYVTQEYIVKKLGDSYYEFKLTIPHGEAAEGFEPVALTTLNSIAD